MIQNRMRFLRPVRKNLCLSKWLQTKTRKLAFCTFYKNNVKSETFLSLLIKLVHPWPSPSDPNPLDSKSNLLINNDSGLF
jgi:hypothetical protein